jgi:hypothetical protein
VLVWSATTPSLRNVGDIALQIGAELFGIAGRVVMALKPGENDIRHVAPGVCFVQQKGPRCQGVEGPSVRKVILAR